MHKLVFGLFAATFPLSVQSHAQASSEISHGQQAIPMTSNTWRVAGTETDVQFVRQEGFPDGIAVLKAGSIALNDVMFRDGTIDFDIKPLSEDIPGIRFRMRGSSDGEEFYIRSLPDCRAENDCIQYSPVIHGFMLWNVYPEYQMRAPVDPKGWNHVRLVINGKRMNVFINDSTKPVLEVGELLGESPEGGIELSGPAAYANLVISPGKTNGLSAIPTFDALGTNPGIVHSWQLGGLSALHYGTAPTYAERPQGSTSWQPVKSERFGILNLNRHFVASKEPPALTWVRTFVDSDQDQVKTVSLGWIGQAWIFLNGSSVTNGKNFYYPDSERRDPDGRLSLENGSFSLSLHKGRNEIVIALYSSVHDDARSRTAYGWALAMRFQDMHGIRFQH